MRGKGSQCELLGPSILESRPGPSVLHMLLTFSVASSFVDLQINQVTMQLRVSLSDLV